MSGRKITPSYRFHEKTGKAIVTYYDADGTRRSTLLPGLYESKESRAEYKRLLARLLANDGAMPKPEAKMPEVLISELIERFMHERVFPYYVNLITKEPTGEQDSFRYAMRPLNRLFGDLPAGEFGPLNLVAVQNAMVDSCWMTDEERAEYTKTGKRVGLARTTINGRIGRIKMMFRWAAKHQIIPASVYHGILAVNGLAEGRTQARDTEGVKPISVVVVIDTLPHLPPVVHDVVELLLLTGARVGEITGMRAIELDMTGEVWLYSPSSHKLAWRGAKYKRTIALGPKAQAIIRRHLKTRLDAFLFSPAEQEAMIAADRRANRKTPVQPSQVSRKKRNPKRKPGERFTHDTINMQSCGRAPERVSRDGMSTNYGTRRRWKSLGTMAWKRHARRSDTSRCK
jgi:integrase